MGTGVWKTHTFNETGFFSASVSTTFVHECRLPATRFLKKLLSSIGPVKFSKISIFILGLLSSLFYFILLLYHT